LAPMGPVGPVALNEVLLVLEPFLLQVAVPPASQRYGKVFVAPIEVTRGMSFYAVFVPGLAEKMFPRKIVEEPILLDTVREGIGGLATNQTRLEEERLALALVAGAAEQRICFSYSRLDLDQARPRVARHRPFWTIRRSAAFDWPGTGDRRQNRTPPSCGHGSPLDENADYTAPVCNESRDPN
jgi:ATP-dependent helicase/nuclease subunit B